MKTCLILTTVLLAACGTICAPIADLDSEFYSIIARLASLGLAVDSIGELLERYEAGDLDEWADDVENAEQILQDLRLVLSLLADLCAEPAENELAAYAEPVKVRYAGVVVTVPRE